MTETQRQGTLGLSGRDMEARQQGGVARARETPPVEREAVTQERETGPWYAVGAQCMLGNELDPHFVLLLGTFLADPTPTQSPSPARYL